MMNTTWQDLAERFRELDAGEGWPFAALVACSVAPKGGNGKTTLAEFARAAGASTERIGRNLKAWELAAADGLVTSATLLTPADADTVRTPTARWQPFYRAAWGRDLPAERLRSNANREPAELVAAMSPEQRAAVVAEVVRTAEPLEVYQVQRQAERRLEDENADSRERARQSERQRAEDRAKRVGWQYAQAEAALAVAWKRTREALNELRGVELEPDMIAVVHRRTEQIRGVCELIDFAVDDDASIDWDAELTKLGAES